MRRSAEDIGARRRFVDEGLAVRVDARLGMRPLRGNNKGSTASQAPSEQFIKVRPRTWAPTTRPCVPAKVVVVCFVGSYAEYFLSSETRY